MPPASTTLPQSPGHPARRQRRSRTAVAAAVLCLLAQVFATVHLVVVRHEVCADHGEVVHGGGIAGQLDRAPEQHGPVLFFWGGKDRFITGDHRRQTVDAMHAAGKPFVHVLYDQADHGFFCDERPSYQASAARGAWGLVRDFLAEHLARHAA